MKAALSAIHSAIRPRLARCFWGAAGITLFYYVLLLLSLMLRFGELPNYATIYNWPANVAHIFASTPSWNDAVDIARGEWLFEIGYINYQFGHGISEWSMTLLPPRMLVIFLLGLLVVSVWVLASEAERACPGRFHRGSALAAAGAGTVFIGFTNVTATWVLCCATPSWIVGLSMLGLSVSTANWIEPLGFWLTLAGFGTLAATIVLLSSVLVRSRQSGPGAGLDVRSARGPIERYLNAQAAGTRKSRTANGDANTDAGDAGCARRY
jgi:hypothetical protein